VSSVIAFRYGDDAGRITVGQTLRSDAKDVIAELKRRGFALVILSGDHKAAVEGVARELGIAIGMRIRSPQINYLSLNRCSKTANAF